MATGPKIPTDPVELLTPDLSREEPFLNKIWGGSLLGTVMFGACTFSNSANKMPAFSGLHRTLFLTAIAAGVGQYLENYRREYFAEKDAVLRHYISLHPEDFPATGRKKFADVFEPWFPIR